MTDVAVRPLTEAELPDAIALVSAGLAEIPVFRWLLGPHRDDPVAVEWLASVFIAPHAALGRVEAAVAGDGTVVGIVAWSAPDLPDPPLPEAVAEQSAAVLGDRQDIVERLRELAAASALHQIPGAHTQIVLGVVDPAVRRSGIPDRLAQPAIDEAIRTGTDIFMTTSDIRLGDAHERTYGAVLDGTHPVGDVTIYRYLATVDGYRRVRAARAEALGAGR